MNRHRAYWPLDDAPLKDGDGGFVGVDERLDPDILPPGMVASATNCRFRHGRVEPRAGITILPWMKADGRTPFTTDNALHVFKVSPPNAYADYVGTWSVFAADGVSDAVVGVRFGEMQNILSAEVRLDGSASSNWWSISAARYPVGIIKDGVLQNTAYTAALNLSAQEVQLAFSLNGLVGNVLTGHYLEIRVTCTSGIHVGYLTYA